MFFILSFVITFFLTPILGRKLEQKGILGEDLHKEDKRKIPEMGGIAIWASVLISLLLAYFYYRDSRILTGISVIFLTGVIGIVDGFKKLNPAQKIISLLAVGIILARGNNLFYFIALPALFMIVCNFTNMLAGFNGLEIGTGTIAALGISVLAYLANAQISFVIASTMFGALLAFLYYNKYPAKIFPGDVGTLIVGAALFTAILFGKLTSGWIVLFPYAVDASLKYFSVGIMTRESQIPTQIRDGKLYIPEGSNLSLPRFFLRKKALGEKELVYIIWVIEVIFSALAIIEVLI